MLIVHTGPGPQARPDGQWICGAARMPVSGALRGGQGKEGQRGVAPVEMQRSKREPAMKLCIVDEGSGRAEMDE